MMDLELHRIFVKVVQNKSFSKAALLLKLPKSTVSKSIAQLERETGTKLLLRTTRSLTLTVAGRAFFEASLAPIQALEEAQRSLYGQDGLLSGLVRVTAPEDLGTHIIAPVIAELTINNQDLNFELQYTDEIVDLVKDGFDLAVRIGKINESSFKIKKVGEIMLVPVASAKYLKGKKKIQHPDDLRDHDCLTYSVQSLNTHWTLRSQKKVVHAPIKPRISSNQMTGLLKMAIADGGVAFVPMYLCREEIKAGKLVRVLPEWTGTSMPVSLITPLAPSSSARLKATIERLYTSLQAALNF